MKWAVCAWLCFNIAPTLLSVSAADDPVENAGVAAGPGAEAGPEPAGDSDGPIIITATRIGQPAFDVPYTINLITQEELIARNHRTMPEALRYTPGVMVQKTAHGQGSPFLRGFTGFRTLFLIDGVRLNNSVFREGPNQYWATVDPYSVGRLEIVMGPSSVLYGSDAIGGTVNAITKNPTGYGQGKRFGGRSYFRAHSGEQSLTGRQEFELTMDDKWGFLFGATGKWYGDIEGGDDIGRQPNTGYDEWDADFKAEHFLNPTTRITLAYQQVQQDNVPRTHSTIFAESFAGTTIGSDLRRDLDQDRRLLYVKFDAEQIENTFFDAFGATLSWHNQEEVQDRIVGGGARRLAGLEVNTLGIAVQLESPSPIGRLIYGLEYYRDWVDSFETRSNESGPRIQGPVGDDASYDLLGVYLEDHIELKSDLTLILGGRFTYARAQADRVRDPDLDPVTSTPVSVDEDFMSFTGSARAVYEVIPQHLNLFGGVSQGFRAPNLSDLTSTIDAASGTREIPTLDLDPENYVQFEIGAKGRKDDVMGGQVSYFYTIVRDQIVRAPTGGVVMGEQIVGRANSGDGYVYGAELAGFIRPVQQVTLFGNLTWWEGRVDTFLDLTDPSSLVEAPLDRTVPLTAVLGARYDDVNRRWWVETTLRLADKADRLSPGNIGDTQRIPPGGTPGYAVWDIRAGWRVKDDLTLYFGVENITDEDYRVHGSGTNEPGRSFVFGLEWKF